MIGCRRLCGLLAVTGLLRLLLAVSVGPSNDEAYYSLFTAHPDWSYFDHPPIVALVESLGVGSTGASASVGALRVGFIVLFAGSTCLMARLGDRCYGPRTGLLAALALNATGYFSLVAGTCALPDGPLLFFWLLTLDRLVRAAGSPEKIGPWLGVGLGWGGALLSKYHAVFLPLGCLTYVLVEPSARRWLRMPGPYLAVALGLACFAPVIWWNAGHGWASFAFQGGRAFGGFRFRPMALAGAVGGQAAYLFPWIWATALAVAGGRVLRWRKETTAIDRLLLCQAVWPLCVFTALATVRPILPHWSLVGFLSLLPMLAQDWARRIAARPVPMKRRLLWLAAAPLVVAIVAVTQTRWGIVQQGNHAALGLVAPAHDPTLDLYGWDQVANELRRCGFLDEPGTFLFTGSWYHSGQLAFATGRKAPVLCYHSGDARSFAFWSAPDEWIGQDGILVALDDRSTEPHCYDRWFTRIEPVGSFPILRAGVPVRQVRLFRCVRQVRPFPFDGGVRSREDGLLTAGRGKSMREITRR